MGDMRTVRLGKSGLEVSKIGFGGIPIQRLSEPEALKVIRRALELGCTWIDTANGYSVSEQRIGKAIRGLPRERVLLFTKGSGRTPEDLERQLLLSLERLQVDALDLYQFHFVPDPRTWKGMRENGTLALLQDYRRRGIVRHIGASAHSPVAAKALLESPEIEVLQYPFNFLMKEAGLEVLEACRGKEVGFIAMKPFGGGELDRASPAIRFLFQFPEVAADPGFEKVGEVEEVIRLAEEAAPLSAADRREMKRLRREVGLRFCRRCGYCSPCPQGVAIISLMTVESFIKRMPRQQVLGGEIARAVETLGACIECGICETKCPYRLPIRERIRAGAQAFQRLQRGSRGPAAAAKPPAAPG